MQSGSVWRLAKEWQYLEKNLICYYPFEGTEFYPSTNTYKAGTMYDWKGNVNAIFTGGHILVPGLPRVDNKPSWALCTCVYPSTMTNLCENPSAETNTTYYNGIAGGETFTRTMETSVYGNYSCLIDMNGIVNYQGVEIRGSGANNTIPVTGGQAYSYSVSCKVDAPRTLALSIYWYDASGAVISSGGNNNVQATTLWGRYYYNATAPSGATGARLRLWNISGAPGVAWKIWFDGVLFVQHGGTTHYFDGSMGNGFSWSGAAHNSTSIRTSIQSTGTLPLRNKGSISVWFKNLLGRTSAYPCYPFFAMIDATKRIYIQIPNSGAPAVRWGSSSSYFTATFSDSNYEHLALVNDGKYVYFYQNGNLLNTSIYDNTIDGNLTMYLNVASESIIDDLLVLDRPMTADEVRALYRYGKSLGLYEDTSCQNKHYFVSNLRSRPKITHVYYRSNAGTWSNNLMTEPLLSNLLPSTVTAGDSIYFGIDTGNTTAPYAVNMHSLFCNEHFETILGTRTSMAFTVEYWNGTAWSALTFSDGTNYLSAGDGIVCTSYYMGIPVALATAVAGAPTSAPPAVWVRYRVTSATSATAPVMRNYPEFIGRPYLDLCSDSLDGDVEALLKIIANIRMIDVKGIILGARSLGRGSDFDAYFNFAPQNNPPFVETYYPAGTGSYTWGGFPGGYCFTISSLGTVSNWSEYYRFRVANSNYAGKYHVFMRARYSSGTQPLNVRLGLSIYNSYASYETPIYYTDAVTLNSSASWEVLDFGYLEIPDMANLIAFDISMEIQKSSATATTYDFNDLILIPVDEMSITATVATGASAIGATSYGIVINGMDDKNNVNVYSYLVSSGQYSRRLLHYLRKYVSAMPGNITRIWFFVPVAISGNETIFRTTIEAAERYNSMRGAT